MDAKEYLRGIRKISYQIKEKREEIATLQAQIEGGSAGFESDGTQSGHTDTERNAHKYQRYAHTRVGPYWVRGSKERMLKSMKLFEEDK